MEYGKYLLLFFIGTFSALAQSIPSVHTINERYDVKDKFPIEKIILKTTYHISDGVREEKEILFLNSKFRVTSSETFDSEGKIIKKRKNEFKSDSVLISSFRSKKIPLIGFETEKIEYEYDSKNELVNIIIKGLKGQVNFIAEFENDERGNPVKMVINKGEYGFETAKYDYDKNNYIYSVYNNNGELLSSNVMKFDKSKPTDTGLYNEFGDLIESEDYLYEYKYDKKGNWKKMIQFKKLGKQKKKTIEYNRKITYK